MIPVSSNSVYHTHTPMHILPKYIIRHWYTIIINLEDAYGIWHCWNEVSDAILVRERGTSNSIICSLLLSLLSWCAQQHIAAVHIHIRQWNGRVSWVLYELTLVTFYLFLLIYFLVTLLRRRRSFSYDRKMENFHTTKRGVLSRSYYNPP